MARRAVKVGGRPIQKGLMAFGSVDNYLSAPALAESRDQSRALKLSVGRMAFQASTFAAILPLGKRQSAST